VVDVVVINTPVQSFHVGYNVQSVTVQLHAARFQLRLGVQGRTYTCKKLDLGSKVAMVRAADLKYYTKTRDFTDVHVVGGHTAYPVRVSPHLKHNKS